MGNLHSTFPDVVGKHTIGSYNNRGSRLTSFCSQYKLFVANTCFKKRRIYTWSHPNGTTRNQIDFIITRQRHREGITDASVLNLPDISDHRLVRATLRTNFSWNKPKPLSKKFDLASLKIEEISSAFQLELRNRFHPLLSEEAGDPGIILNDSERLLESYHLNS